MSVELVGPFTDHVLIVNGRQVPFVTPGRAMAE